MKKKRSGKFEPFRIFNAVFFLFIFILMIYPLWYIIMGSFYTNSQFNIDHVHLWAKPFTLKSYKYLLGTQDFLTPYLNTIIVCSFGTLMSLLATAMGGYVLSKKFLRGRNFVMALIIFTMIFSGGIVPSYILVSRLKMTNTLWSLFIPGLINTFYLIIMRTSMSALPESLEESARIDGASFFVVFFRIVLPLSQAILATIMLFYIVDRWNDVMTPLLYITKSKYITLQYLLYRLIYATAQDVFESGNVTEEQSIREIQKFAAVVLSSAPVLMVYPFLQKYFVKGVLIGSVKG